MTQNHRGASDDDWFDYRLEHDPRFLGRGAAARSSLRAGQRVRVEDLDGRNRAHQGPAPARGQRRVSPKPAVSRRRR